MFGLNCSSPCHCLPGASCDNVYGNCSGELCAPGWTESNCSVGKIHTAYASTMSVYDDRIHILVRLFCLIENDKCHLRVYVPTYIIYHCVHDVRCSSSCRCYNGSICDHVTGHCPDGQCAPGWTSTNLSLFKIELQ